MSFLHKMTAECISLDSLVEIVSFFVVHALTLYSSTIIIIIILCMIKKWGGLYPPRPPPPLHPCSIKLQCISIES